MESQRPTGKLNYPHTLESLIDVGQGISVGPGRFGKQKNVGPGKFGKKNNCRAGKI